MLYLWFFVELQPSSFQLTFSPWHFFHLHLLLWEANNSECGTARMIPRFYPWRCFEAFETAFCYFSRWFGCRRVTLAHCPFDCGKLSARWSPPCIHPCLWYETIHRGHWYRWHCYVVWCTGNYRDFCTATCTDGGLCLKTLVMMPIVIKEGNNNRKVGMLTRWCPEG